MKDEWKDVIPEMYRKSANIEDHIAFTCYRCGCVKFCLLKSGNIECSQCGFPVMGKWKEKNRV